GKSVSSTEPLLKHVAHAAYRMDQLVGKVVVDLQAQAADRDFDAVGIAVEVHVPHLRGNQRLGQYFALAAQQQFQQGKLLGREVDALAVAFYPAADQVHAQVGQLQAGFLRRAAATAQQAAHSGQQFGEG